MKKEYTQPIIDVIELDVEDIITESTPINMLFGGNLAGDEEVEW